MSPPSSITGFPAIVPPTAQVLPFPQRTPAPCLVACADVRLPSSLPGRAASPSSLPAGGPTGSGAPQLTLELGSRGLWCGVLYVARQLRLEAVDLRTVVTHIRAHIAAGGFPLPVTSRLRHGLPLTGAEAVTPKSEWLRASVDGWIAARAAEAAGPLILSLSKDAAQLCRAEAIDTMLAGRFALPGGLALPANGDPA